MSDASPPPDRDGLVAGRGLLTALVASVVLGAGLWWMLRAGGLPLVPSRASLEGVSWAGVGAYVVVWFVILFLRSARWTLLLRPLGEVPFRRVLTVSFMGLAAVILLPFRMGEAVRPALIARGSPISGWAAVGTVAAERVMDGLFLSLALLAGLQTARPLDPLPDRIGELPVSPEVVMTAAPVVAFAFAGAFVVMAVFYWRRVWARRLIQTVLGVISPRMATWVADRLDRLASGLRFLPDVGTTLWFGVLTGVYWALSALGMWLLMWACGLPGMSPGHSLVVLGVLAIGVVVPTAPGYFGTFQLSLFGALALYLPPDLILGPGAVFVFLLYVIQIVATLLLGGVSFAVEQRVAGRSPADGAQA